MKNRHKPKNSAKQKAKNDSSFVTNKSSNKTEDKSMSDINKINDEALKNVTGGMAGIVDTGTDQNAVIRSGAGKGA